MYSIIETAALITTKFCTTIKTTNYLLFVDGPDMSQMNLKW